MVYFVESFTSFFFLGELGQTGNISHVLDEAFFLKKTQQKHLWTVYLAHHGNDPLPVYTLKHPDPASPTSANRYAVALADPFVPNIIYGEVLIVPEWTQPSLSPDAIRQNGGVTPPPEPIMPTQFTIHLYNPDQEITVHFKPKSWNTPATWSFDMPQHSFRQPSSSTLDHTQTDPAVADTTPKLRFNWRRDSKLSKDLTCLLSGKTSTLPETKTKSKEPDITLSIFQGLRELTLYEPNLYRVEMEDFKGLELVLLLGAVTIRDVYFAPMKDSFHLSRSAAGLPTSISTSTAASTTTPSNKTKEKKNSPTTATGALNSIPEQHEQKPLPSQPVAPQRKQKDTERREEERRTKKLLEEEDKARRKRQTEVDKETRRLQKLYGQEEEKVRQQSHTPVLPPRPSQPQPQRPGPSAQQYYQYHHHAPSMPHARPGPYLGVPSQSSVSFVPTRPQSTVGAPQQQPQTLQPKKSSFFGFRRSSDEGKLAKKRSSMF
ncbi:hypothetical protein FE257_008412 [Aspergillus nanangensis]|uniref:Uncharacterized protein n=1 Tax=Aspergillus nanangensis TaxID=2582783 RepID=A0AAD4CLC0_ASPNN|nr:hypothetical protein FE257_008412 [Aspergillus nanangensis]